MTYRNMIRYYISPSLGNCVLSGIDQKRVDDFINHPATSAKKDGKGLSPKTVSDVVSVLKNILLYSQKTENIPFCIEFRLPRCPRSEIRIFSLSEQEKLTAFIIRKDKTENRHKHKNRTVGDCRNPGILLSLYTGLRIGEVCALQWKDISFDEKTIIVRKTLQRISDPPEEGQKTKLVMTDPKSDCSKRIIPLPDFLTAFLAGYRKDDDDCPETKNRSSRVIFRLISGKSCRNAGSGR